MPSFVRFTDFAAKVGAVPRVPHGGRMRGTGEVHEKLAEVCGFRKVVPRVPHVPLEHKPIGVSARERMGVPVDWLEGFARLSRHKRPYVFTNAAWRQLLIDGERFLVGSAAMAAKLGWTTLDVFGLHPTVPVLRYDAMGLVALIRGGKVTTVTDKHATITMPSGAALSYLRRPMPHAVAVWDLTVWRTDDGYDL